MITTEEAPGPPFYVLKAPPCFGYKGSVGLDHDIDVLINKIYIGSIPYIDDHDIPI